MSGEMSRTAFARAGEGAVVVAAVLGHRTSVVAIPASVTYEASRVLFLPPFATASRLTLHGFQYVS